MKKTSKILSLFLVLAVCIGMFSGIPASAANSDSDFVVQDGVLIKYNGTAKDVVIPDGVTEIGKEAFTTYLSYDLLLGAHYEGDSITSVFIPDSVKKIGDSAFRSCKMLTLVKLPSSSVTIGDSAFTDCGLLSAISFPSISLTIGNSVFAYPAITKLNFGNSSVSIGEYAFSNCEKLTSASGTNVTALNRGAFAYCSSLSDVNFPNTSTVGEFAFSTCTSLKSVTLGGTQYGNMVFGACGINNLSIFHGLKTISPYMFSENNFNDINLIIPNSVTCIGEYAFPEQKLLSVIIPPSVTSIGKNAFPTLLYNGWIPVDGTRTEAETEKLKTLKTIIYGVAGSTAQTYAKQQGNPFVAISAEQANAGKIPTGSFTIDTGIYTMAPGNIYQIGAKATGMKSVAVQCYSSVSGVASVTKLKNGNYQIKGIKPGTTYIMFDIIKGRTKVGHMSVRVDVKKGVKQGGQSKVQTVSWN